MLNQITVRDKAHGNVGNSNAVKADKQNAKLHLGCHQSDKSKWVKQAQSEGKKLGQWVTEQLNNAAGRI